VSEPRRFGLWLRFGVPVVAAVLTLVAVEAGSYLFGRFDGPRQPLRVGNIQFFGQHDDLLFWKLRPGATGPDGQPWINSDGLRGPEVGAKQEGEFRILSLGESSTFAAQLPYDSSYSAVLERRLNESRATGSVRVLNGGVPGYSLFQGVTFLQHRAPTLEPDMVLLYFGFNDFLPAAYLAARTGGDAGGLNDRQLFEQRRRPLARFVALLTRHSNLVRGVRQRAAAGAEEKVTTDKRLFRVPDEDRLALLTQAATFCRDHEIELVVIVPIYRSFDRHVSLLRNFAERKGVTAVDLPRLLEPRFEGRKGAYFLDAAHPGGPGHGLIAEAIEQVISPRIPQ